MFRTLKLFVTSLLVVGLFFASGCEEEPAPYDLDVASFERAAEDASTLSLTLGDCEGAETDASEDAEEAPCFWVQATVNIGGVVGVEWVWVCGNTVTVWIPNDPVLIGLPITVTIPGVGQACGTVTL